MKLWQAITAAALIWAAVFLPGLGTQELKGEEGRRILPARNMLQDGEWAVPHIGGEIYSRKPPLLNWLIAGSFSATGVQNEWSARLPSALAVMLLGVTIVVCGGHWMRGAGVAFIAAVFAITNVAFLEKGRLAEIEPIYVALTGIAFAIWSKLYMEVRSPWLTWVVPWFFLGLGLLAKGPVHLLFFYAPVIGVLVVGKRWRQLLHPAHAAGIGLMLAVFLPWVVVNHLSIDPLSPGGGPPSGVWFAEIVSRLQFGSGGVLGWISTPFKALFDYFPWIVPLIFLWWRISQWRWNVSPTLELQLDRPTRREWMRGVAWGVAVSVCLLVILPGAAARYTHPAIGPASMLLAIMVSQLAPGHAIHDRLSVIWKRSNQVVLVICGLVLILVPPVTLFWGNWVFPVLWFAVGCVVCGTAAVTGWRLARNESLVLQTGASACAIAAGMQLYSIAILPATVSEDNVRPIGQAFDRALPADSRLCVLNPGIQPFLFYIHAPYEVVATFDEVPIGITHLLMGQKQREKWLASTHSSKGSPTEVLSMKDKDGETWSLLDLREEIEIEAQTPEKAERDG